MHVREVCTSPRRRRAEPAPAGGSASSHCWLAACSRCRSLTQYSESGGAEDEAGVSSSPLPGAGSGRVPACAFSSDDSSACSRSRRAFSRRAMA